MDNYIEEGVEARRSLDLDLIYRIGSNIGGAFNSGSKVILFGNGGERGRCSTYSC